MKELVLANCTLPGGEQGTVRCLDGKVSGISADTKEGEGGDEATVIDCRGGSLFTGFTDSHCHPFELGRLKSSIDLRGTSNLTAVRMRLHAVARKAVPGAWIVGRGWDHELLSERRLPARGDVDDVTPGNPVLLQRVCGHISLLNTMALKSLRLYESREDGIDIGLDGSPTGIVREGAQEEAFRRMPERSAQSCLDDLLAVEFEVAKAGLTTLHCILSEEGFRQEIEALAFAASREEPAVGYRVYVPLRALEDLRDPKLVGRVNRGAVRINGVKLYADGSLGARTAALREPYADDPGNTGVLRYSDDGLHSAIGAADEAGYQVIVHAIGDRAVEQAVAALSAFSGGGNPKRHRVEHASLIPRDLRAKMKRHSLRAAVQPCFVLSDVWAKDRLGEERVRDLYPFRSMLDDGIIASGSSDSPVETISPTVGMWASVVRPASSEGEALTLAQALDLYTRNAASNGFDDDSVGLREGATADFTVLDSNVDGMHPAIFRKVGVAATVVRGAVSYSFEGS